MSSSSEVAGNEVHYTFEAEDVEDAPFRVVEVDGTEELGRPFRFDLRLVAERADLDFDRILNRRATLTMRRGRRRRSIHGLVARFSQRGRSADYVSYRATLRPRLHRLSLTRRSRIFQDAGIEEILGIVLKEGGIPSSDVHFRWTGSSTPRTYCVQYQETDLHFVHRLLEAEGAYYFFDHADGRDRMVVTDDTSTHDSIPPPATLRYHDGAGGMVARDRETVDRFVQAGKMVPGRVQLTDHNPRTPETMTVESEAASDMPGTRHEYTENFRSPDRGKTLADVRAEEISARGRIITADSNCAGICAGGRFSLRQHYRDEWNTEYLVTRVEHRGTQRRGLDLDARMADDDVSPDPAYQNHFHCLPASMSFRPRRETEKPTVPGVLTATVESAGGDYAYVDDEGRYRARFRFDERHERSDGTRTLPIRLTQPYTGSDYGMHFPNHAGTELVIAFENGDIDRPIALGTVPNAANASPTTATNKMKNILRTYGGNELLMDDTTDETRVSLQSARARELRLDDETCAVRLLSTENHEVRLDDENSRIEIRSENGRTLVVDDQNEEVRLVTAEGPSLRLSDADEAVSITDAEDRHVLSLDYADDTMLLDTEGDVVLDADGALEMRAASFSLETDEGAEMNVGGNLTQTAQGNVKLQGGQNTTVEAGQTLTATGGATIDLSARKIVQAADAKIEADATTLTLEGTALAEMNGGIVKVNG